MLIQDTRERTVPLVAAASLVIFGLLLIADQIWWRRRAVTVPGRIIGFLAETGQQATLYRAVVEFQSPGDGQRLGRDDSASASLIGRRIGQSVEVLVTPADFPTVRIHRHGRIQTGITLMAGGSVLGALLWGSRTEGALFLAFLALQIGVVFYYLLLARAHPTALSLPEPGEDLARNLVPPEAIAREKARIARVNRIAAPAGLLVATALLAGSGYAAWDVLQLRALGASAEGRVLGYETERIRLDAPVYRAVVSFTPAGPRGTGAEPVTFTDRFGSSRPRWQPGERVAVLYDPQDLQRAQIDAGPAGNLMFAVLLGLAGLIVLRMSAVAFASVREVPAAGRAPAS